MSLENFNLSSGLALISTIQITDYLDILIVTYITYKFAKFFKDTRAVQVLKGIVILVFSLQLSEILKLNTINFILKNTMQVGLIAIFIVFQPELRSALARMGRSKFSFFNFEDPKNLELTRSIISAVSLATKQLSETKTGALIVIERNVKIMDIVRTGIVLDAIVSSELLTNIFYPKAPLHDGAVIISGGKIISAGCFLPLSQNESLESELGTRHRAGLGISEGSDCIVVIVSEETGKITLACDGGLTRNISPTTLKNALTKLLLNEDKREKKQKNNPKERSR
jgi:diadenylate cyclase